jgi:hypothetical protein
VGHPGSEACFGLNISKPIAETWPDTLPDGELPLEQLASSDNGTERVTGNEKQRRIRRQHIPTARPNLLLERFLDTSVLHIGELAAIRLLGVQGKYASATYTQGSKPDQISLPRTHTRLGKP